MTLVNARLPAFNALPSFMARGVLLAMNTRKEDNRVRSERFSLDGWICADLYFEIENDNEFLRNLSPTQIYTVCELTAFSLWYNFALSVSYDVRVTSVLVVLV